MARVGRLTNKALGLLTMLAIVALAVWLMPDRQISSAQDRPNGKPPGIAAGLWNTGGVEGRLRVPCGHGCWSRTEESPC